MRCRAIRPFPYAHAGTRARMVVEGEELDVQDELVPGLRSVGLIYVPAHPKVETSDPLPTPSAPTGPPANADRGPAPENRASKPKLARRP